MSIKRGWSLVHNGGHYFSLYRHFCLIFSRHRSTVNKRKMLMGYNSDQTDEPSVHLVLIIFFYSYQVLHHLHQLSLLLLVKYLHQLKFFLDVNYYHIHHHHYYDKLNDFHFHKLKKKQNFILKIYNFIFTTIYFHRTDHRQLHLN